MGIKTERVSFFTVDSKNRLVITANSVRIVLGKRDMERMLTLCGSFSRGSRGISSMLLSAGFMAMLQFRPSLVKHVKAMVNALKIKT